MHAPFSSVDAMIWVTHESHFFNSLTLDILSNSETISCNPSDQEGIRPFANPINKISYLYSIPALQL